MRSTQPPEGWTQTVGRTRPVSLSLCLLVSVSLCLADCDLPGKPKKPTALWRRTR
jgi:hypothetical protein